MLAALIEGEFDLADWLFLFAALAAALACLAYAVLPPYKNPPAALVAGALALASFAWLVL
jgi:hypothetical protein